AGITRRLVRSPVAPKSTMAQGSAGPAWRRGGGDSTACAAGASRIGRLSGGIGIPTQTRPWCEALLRQLSNVLLPFIGMLPQIRPRREGRRDPGESSRPPTSCRLVDRLLNSFAPRAVRRFQRHPIV